MKLSSLIIAVAFLGCATSDDTVTAPEQGQDGFALLQHDDTTIDAVYESAGASLHFTATESEPRVVDVTFDYGNTVVAFHIDHNTGAGDFMPSGQPLDASQRRITELMAGEIAELIDPNTDTRSTVEDSSYRQSSFMLIVPTGEPLVAGTFNSQRGWSHISPSCGTKNLSGYNRTCGKGCGCTGGSGNGCKGRCGQGCGGTSTPKCVGSTAYTVDCAKHDWGLGSWWAASDDYASATNNASCSGTNCY